MLTCGIKVSHDGGVAVIEDNRLLFSIEVEKLENGFRYSSLGDLDRVAHILASEGLAPSDVDRFVVDGWWTQGAGNTSAIQSRSRDRPLELPVAPYLDGPGAEGPVRRYVFQDYDFSSSASGYVSYYHISNHLLGAYCSSPFAARGEDALVLVWDGGTVPRLYHVEARIRTVTAVSSLLPITGNSFALFSSQFEPFRWNIDGLSTEEVLRYHLSIAERAMAYTALGRVEESAFPILDDIINDFLAISPYDAQVLAEMIAVNRDEVLPGLSNADLIATFQAYLGKLLLQRLSALMQRDFPGQHPHLAFAGVCALNIKWNTMLRNSGLFDEIWIPPFPNDSGAAIGTACCEMFREGGHLALDWDVYSGPPLAPSDVPEGWRVQPCDERQLAGLLHAEGEPVVVLSGRAAIGPRALGNRSIFAPATDPGMKDRLNAIKDRAKYRPVTAVCLTSRAAEVFIPGTSDRYMLFEHRLRPGWAERLPAVVHLDGTARLQTIDGSVDSATGRILTAYEQISGIPVLGHASANVNSRGFFPDIASAAQWGGTRYIWSERCLYTNPAAKHQGNISMRPTTCSASVATVKTSDR